MVVKKWFPILRKEIRLKEFKNRILRQIFGSKRDENGERIRLYNDERHSLYRSPNTVSVIKSKRLNWTGYIARMEEGRSVFRILTGKPTGKRLLESPCECSIEPMGFTNHGVLKLLRSCEGLLFFYYATSAHKPNSFVVLSSFLIFITVLFCSRKFWNSLFFGISLDISIQRSLMKAYSFQKCFVQRLSHVSPH